MKALDTKKHVTPKWVDRLLIGLLLSMPVLYIAGFSINYGPSMSYLGWFYRTSWGEQPSRVGQIVRFAQPGQPAWRKYILPSIKRVAEIRKDGYYVEGDNTEHSQDSRDWCKDVPPDHVVGILVWCWSPARAWRGRTETGRFDNYLSMTYAPGWVIYREDERNFAVYRPGDSSTIVNGTKYNIFPAGGIDGDPILVSPDYSKAYRIRAGRLVPTRVTQGDPFAVTGRPEAREETARANGWTISGLGLPICDNPLGAIADGDEKTGWFAPPGLNTMLVIDFGTDMSREIVVVHPGRAAGDIQFAASADKKSWTKLQPSMRGFKPSMSGFPRQLGVQRCRYLWISNSFRSGTTIYEVRAK